MLNQPPSAWPFLPQGGEMGALTRAFDWARSPVGPPEQWPQSLRTTVSMILASRFPTFLWWGPELIQFYNDAYRPSLGGEGGKHPAALGRPGVQTWPETWPIIKPLIDQVLRGEESTWSEDQLIPMERNGHLEDVYWTFSYSPVRDDQDQIAGVLVICQETTQQVVRQRELTLSEQWFRHVFEQAPVGVALFSGPHYVITLANQRVLAYWDRPSDQVVDKPLFEALPETRGQGLESLLQGVYQTGNRFVAKEMPITLTRQGQSALTYTDFVCEPVRDREQAITGILVVCTEVTEQVQQRHVIATANEELAIFNEELMASYEAMAAANGQLREVNGQLNRSNESLQQFAYVASHDLQEPLRKIQAFGALLQDQYSSQLGEAADYVQRMQVAAARLSRLTHDLLSFSRISTQQDSQELTPLNKVIDLVLTDLELQIGEAQADIEVNLLPSVLGDARQLGQLFQNLLSNALKFRCSATRPLITIRSTRIASTTLPGRVKPVRVAKFYYRIDVTDNGIGFDQDYAERIFQVFQRLHGKSSAYGGTGIGLAICEKVAANHGGAITATSQPGQGATFSVYLPI
ncbi:sensor histidine kinase [Fibrella forsythiae]|uniref:histidine kinase n=1 Tax=Fibrella forsythiae TaxID=2817061 RepID=A0ABS3JSF8_9BACT|nr:ATP-binding protein [Fibrella forsythiae]MBO0952941.1 PAS domain-containing protein [Fibrella forsythiae]